MGNTILKGNVSLINTQGLVAYPGSGNQAKIRAFAFWSSDSTGLLLITDSSDTTNPIINMASPVNEPNMTQINFTDGKYFNKLNVQTLVNGTGYVYFA